MLLANDCFAAFRGATTGASGRPVLFLDRDGVVVEEVRYLSQAEDVRLIPGARDVVAAARGAGWRVGLVTNQAGIGRGLYGWPDFKSVQAALETALGADAALDFVIACPHHAEAASPRYRVADHPWRKPRPGMIAHVLEQFGSDPARCALVGDHATDIAAGRAAGLGRLFHVLTGHGATHRSAMAKFDDVTCVASIRGAGAALFANVGTQP